MPTFVYSATDMSGKKIEGTLDAKDEAGALNRIRGMNYFPIRVATKKEPSVFDFKISFFKKVSEKEVLNFTQELATLIKAGLPIDRSFTILGELAKKKNIGVLVEEIQKNVHAGSSFADALAKYPETFSKLYVNMVKAGETGGVLDTVLLRLESFLEQSQRLRDDVRAAMVYPILLTFAGGAAIAVLLTFVIPRFAKIFKETGQTLPLSTEILLAVSFFVKGYWWALIFGFVAAIVLFKILIAKGKGREKWDTFKLKIPVFGILIRKIEVSRFARMLGTLLKSGVPILNALNIVKDTATNSVVGASVVELYKGVKEGGGISSPLRRTGVFPPLAVHMITVGEETGKLEDMLYKVADTFDEEITRSVKSLTSLLEPLMILFMGLVVGFIVISMLLAIFSMNEIPI